jgi:hypothetical protein
MSRYTLTECRRHHCGQMARRMRAANRVAMIAAGCDPHLEIVRRYYESSYRRAWLIDGQLGAIGGVSGTLAASDGYIWMVVAEIATCHALALARMTLGVLAEVSVTFRRVESLMVAADERAVEFARFLGFCVVDGGPPWAVTMRYEGRV